MAAAAALAGRPAPTDADLWPIVAAVPTAEGQQVAREALHDLLESSESAALPTAAVEASAGYVARSHRLAEAGTALLAQPAPTEDAWRLKVEGVLRDIDASFARPSLPEVLTDMREALATALRDPS